MYIFKLKAILCHKKNSKKKKYFSSPNLTIVNILAAKNCNVFGDSQIIACSKGKHTFVTLEIFCFV